MLVGWLVSHGTTWNQKDDFPVQFGHVEGSMLINFQGCIPFFFSDFSGVSTFPGTNLSHPKARKMSFLSNWWDMLV